MRNLIFLLLLLVLVLPITGADALEYPTSSKNIRLFFNQPPSDDGIEDLMVSLIDGANQSITAAFFEIGRQKILEALLRAGTRLGTDKIKLVSERTYVTGKKLADYYSTLEEAGILVEYDGKRRNPGQGLMHNKFMVIDGKTLWTGSMNLTDNNMMMDANNSLLIQSAELASIYLREFEEMFTDGNFGKRKLDNTKKNLKIDGIPIKILFSPTDLVNESIVEAIDKAEKSVYFAAFTFTSKPIAQAMMRARKRGCDVKGLFDNMSGKSRHSAYNMLKERNFNVKLDDSHHLIHHKFIIIDQGEKNPLLITGSHNFTKGANQKNDENTLFIYDGKAASAYYTEFLKLFDPKGEDKIDLSIEEVAVKPEVPVPVKAIPPVKETAKVVAEKPKVIKKPAPATKDITQNTGERNRFKALAMNRKERVYKMVSEELTKQLTLKEKEIQEVFASYQEMRKNYDQLGIFSFDKKNLKWRELKKLYNEYDIERRCYNTMVSIHGNKQISLPKVINGLYETQKNSTLRARRLSREGKAEEAQQTENQAEAELQCIEYLEKLKKQIRNRKR